MVQLHSLLLSINDCNLFAAEGQKNRGNIMNRLRKIRATCSPDDFCGAGAGIGSPG
jgi:hypothetical protein